MAIEAIRKYMYIWQWHTYVRFKKWWEKIRIEEWEVFETSFDKNNFSSIAFKFLWEYAWTVKEKKVEIDYSKEILWENKDTSSKKEVKEEKESRKKLIKEYFERFWKKPFPGRSNEEILDKLSM